MALANSAELNITVLNTEKELESLYIQHFDTIKRYIVNNGGTQSDAEDAYQEAFLALWRNLKTGRLKSLEDINVGGYLFNISKFKWIDVGRKKQTHLKMVQERTNDTTSGIDADDAVSERIASVKKCLEQMDGPCKKVLLMFYYQKKTMQEIATEMRWQEATARNNKYRCMEKLRTLFNQKNG